MNLRGFVPVLATPFDVDERIDEESLRNQADFTIKAGATAICVPGFGSEFYKLSDPERYRMAEVVIEQVARRAPVVISTGSGSVHSTIEFSRYAEHLGADCLMVLAPQIVPLGMKELKLFYDRVCESVSIPIMLQDADFSGRGLPAELFIELARSHPNFKFAKLEIPFPGRKCKEIIQRSGGKLQVLYGLWGIYMADGFAHGASGIMAGPGLTEAYVQMLGLFEGGRIEESKAWLRRMQPYLIFCLQHVEAGLILDKRMLMRRGILPSSRLREPVLQLDDSYVKEMDELIDLGLAICKGATASRTAVT
jgi:4-hydroxy-tetrahydrodipicolinate synthase